MRVLVACEFSGTVRDAFAARGHDAWSCDLLPCDKGPEHHIQGNVLGVLDAGWDLMIAHPPCTHLAVSGAAWFHKKAREQAEALEFVLALMRAPIPRIAVENPVSIISSRIARPTQIIQPWQFGHSDMKSTCLWLKDLPRLMPTNIVDRGVIHVHESGRRSSDWSMRTFKMPKAERWKERSRTFTGIAEAMADQWGNAPLPLRLGDL